MVTEQRPAWVDVLSQNDTLRSAIALPRFSAPSDANEAGPNDIIVTDRTQPGKIAELARAADSGNDRVIVIDPTNNKIVWQYGHTDTPGTEPGYLHNPGSVTLVPIGK